MRPALPLLAALAFLAGATRSEATLRDALIARQVLADVAATCVVRVEFLPAPAPRQPIFAIAFSLENDFWLYAPEIGTRALGPATEVWPDPATLSSRLHGLDPTVLSVTVYANPVSAPFKQDQLFLANACVIGSLHSLLWVLHNESGLTEAGLILMSYDTTDASTAAALVVNHSLLAYRLHGQWWCIDPRNDREPFKLKHVKIGAPLDPALVELALKQDYPVKSVCLLPLSRATLGRIAANVQWQLPGFSD